MGFEEERKARALMKKGKGLVAYYSSMHAWQSRGKRCNGTPIRDVVFECHAQVQCNLCELSSLCEGGC